MGVALLACCIAALLLGHVSPVWGDQLAAPKSNLNDALKASIKTLQRQHGKKWAHASLDSINGQVQANAKRFFHAARRSTKDHIVLPVPVDVLLLGLDGSGAYGQEVDRADLESFLKNSLSEHCPTVGAAAELSLVCYDVEFNVQHAAVRMESFTDALSASLVKTGERKYDSLEDGKTEIQFLVDAAAMEPVIDSLVAAHYDQRSDTGPSVPDREANIILVINPSKLRVAQALGATVAGLGAAVAANVTESGFPARWDAGTATEDELEALDGGFRYRYSYGGVGHLATWLSSGRYIVIDLSAGPCAYGPEASPSGAVTHSALPGLADLFRTSRRATQTAIPSDTPPGPAAAAEAAKLRSALLKGRLAAVLTSAARHVVLPDVGETGLQFTRGLLVPVIVLRNHQRFNPLEPDRPWSLDLELLQQQAQALADTNQTVSVVSALHQLSAHPALAVAVQSALSSRSEAVLTGWEADAPSRRDALGIHSRTAHYIDGDVLLEAFADSSETLMQALMDSGDWRTRQLYDEAISEAQATRQGTRVLPIFVLSLVDLPFGVQFREGGLLLASPRAVLVLQTMSVAGAAKGISVIPTNHISEGQPLIMDSLRVTRHLVAGFATATCGAVAPFEHYARPYQTTQSNWLWAGGHQPFGPYSKSSALSSLLQSACRRGLVLSRMHVLLKRFKVVVASTEAFLNQHLALPFGEKLGVEHLDSHAPSWLDTALRQGSDSRQVGSLPGTLYRRVMARISGVEADVEHLSVSLLLGNHRQTGAATIRLAERVAQLELFAADALSNASSALACCSLRQAPSFWTAPIVFAGFGLLFAALVSAVLHSRDHLA